MTIRGAGGGGKSGGGESRAPIESPDSLRSRQYARVVDVICEGEVEGLIDGLKSIYLNDTPVQNADGSFNFSGVSLVSRTGTQSQEYIPGFQSVGSETAVSVDVKQSVPVVRSISNPNADAVRVTVSVPQLTLQNIQNGDLGGTSIQLAIDVQSAGGGYVKVIADTISGKTTSRYQRAYRIELDGGGPWDVRIRRITADSTEANLRNMFYWDSYTEIIDAKLTYPNTALCALSVDAERFQSIPTRGYEMRGVKVRIPDNYDPVARTYDGIWTGGFTTAWTNNPAWCFYDLLITKRYGLGDYIDGSQVDKWALYKIAQYCDELVDDGMGGFEPRFTCNLYLQTREEAYNVVNTFASIFCGLAYWAGGSIVAVQDAPADPVALFTPANVLLGENNQYFSYTGSSLKTRHTVALVSWNDPADRYRQKIEYVEDAIGIARYGVIQTEVVAIGCTSRGQAHRYGRRILFAERMETEVAIFRVGLDGLCVTPGEIIQTSDPVRAGVRMGGRIIAADGASVTLDSEVVIESGNVYTLWVVLPDGVVESRSVVSSPGTSALLSVSPGFSAIPEAMSVWVLASADLLPETWRVISMTEVKGTQADITALAYRQDKYAEIEAGLRLEPLPVSSLNGVTRVPTDIQVMEVLYLVTPVVVGARITVSWSGNQQYYELQYRRAESNWATISTSASSIDIQPVEPGKYQFSLIAINAAGRRSAPVQFTKTVYGLSAPPNSVAGFRLAAISGMAHLSFDPATDLDVIVGGHLRIRHTPELSLPKWSNATDIGPQIPGTATNTTLPLLAGTYLAKWVDSRGIESVADVGIITDAPNVMSMNIVDMIDEGPLFSGAKSGVVISGPYLTLDSAETIGEQFGNVSTWSSLGTLGGLSPVGEYLFSRGIDLGSTQTARISAGLMADGVDALDLIASRPLVSTWASVVGDVITDVSCTIFVRTTTDDPDLSPVWGSWQTFFVGEYIARGFQFKAVLGSNYPNHNILVSELLVTIDMPDRMEQGDDIDSGVGTHRVTFSLPFMVPPAIGITAQDMQTGDYYSVTNKTEEYFDITFRNAAGSAVSRTFDFYAKRY